MKQMQASLRRFSSDHGIDAVLSLLISAATVLLSIDGTDRQTDRHRYAHTATRTPLESGRRQQNKQTDLSLHCLLTSRM